MFTLLATVVLKEDVGWRRWCAVLLGFFEVVLVADLQQASWTSWALLLPLLAAFLTAARDLFVRNIPSVLSSTQVAFTTAWVVTLGGLATLPFGWKALDSEQFLLLALASVFILIAYLSYVITTRIGELSYVAPFKYTSIPLAMLMGYLIWDDIPSNMSYLGTAIIISSGLFILIRNDSKAASIKQQEPLVTELN
jgi:drug/metabolite transporter (DMT)-like permease